MLKARSVAQRRKRRPKYPKPLNTRMTRHRPSRGLLGGVTEEEARRRNTDEVIYRIVVLMEHYGIDPKAADAWPRLAFQLASDHVVGLQYKDYLAPGRGAEAAWNAVRELQLCADVTALRKRVRSASRACQLLAQQRQYAERYAGSNAATLRRRYSEALKRFALSDIAGAEEADLISRYAMDHLRG